MRSRSSLVCFASLCLDSYSLALLWAFFTFFLKSARLSPSLTFTPCFSTHFFQSLYASIDLQSVTKAIPTTASFPVTSSHVNIHPATHIATALLSPFVPSDCISIKQVTPSSHLPLPHFISFLLINKSFTRTFQASSPLAPHASICCLATSTISQTHQQYYYHHIITHSVLLHKQRTQNFLQLPSGISLSFPSCQIQHPNPSQALPTQLPSTPSPPPGSAHAMKSLPKTSQSCLHQGHQVLAQQPCMWEE